MITRHYRVSILRRIWLRHKPLRGKLQHLQRPQPTRGDQFSDAQKHPAGIVDADALRRPGDTGDFAPGRETRRALGVEKGRVDAGETLVRGEERIGQAALQLYRFA